ncbi:MAG: M48 family metallopeptidase [Alistipes sp.]|nr:M48 family metallopeptidase [Alistipes sp.]MDE5906230.1 M48 family metallopeptidase [Alistipes sp.]
MISVVDHPRLGRVVLSQSPRARRIAIRVRPSGEVRVSFPCGVSARRAEAFLNEKAEWVESARQRLAARRAALPPALPPDEEKARVEALRRAAKADLPARIERLSRQTGLSFGRLTIRAARSKWGSCSGRNSISLSLFLMTLPEHLRDFVIIHELCHTVHHDHSPRFHALVDRFTGGHEKALSRELRAFSIR